MDFTQIWIYVIIPLLSIIGGVLVYYNIALYHIKQELSTSQDHISLLRDVIKNQQVAIQELEQQRQMMKNAYANISNTFSDISLIITDGMDKIVKHFNINVGNNTDKDNNNV